MTKNTADDPPKLFVEEIREIDAIDPEKPVPGLAFYADDEGDEVGQ